MLKRLFSILILDICFSQVTTHLKKLKERHSEFKLAPHKTQYDPNKEEELLRILFPQVPRSFSSSSGFLSHHLFPVCSPL